jgi:hypothetical protein
MVEIAIIDWDYVKRKTKEFFKTAVPATLLIAALSTLCGTVIYALEHAAIKNKARQVEQKINSDEFEEAKKILDSGRLHDEDQERLVSLYEQEKSASELEQLIEDADYRGARSCLEELEERFPEKAKGYALAVDALNPETIYESFKKRVGTERINYAKKIMSLIEHGEKVQGVDDMGALLFETYFSALNFNFEHNLEASSTDTLLRDFRQLVTSQDISGYLGGLDIDLFYSNGLKYVSALPRDTEIHVGDTVRTVKALGSIKGENDEYFEGGDLAEYPIGTELIVFSIAENRERYDVGKTWTDYRHGRIIRLIRNEIQKKDDYSGFRKNLDEIYRVLKNVEQPSEETGD